MTEQVNIQASEVSFNDFLFKNKRNRTILWLAAAAIVIQFAVFKYLYPFASFIHGDSFSYIKAAYYNLDINTYMVGYSRFLRLFSVFTKSDTALVAFQYFLLQCSSVFFTLTLFYSYKPSRIIKFILFIFIVFNPLFLHLSNLISSDSLFLSLSLLWITTLIWIINNPTLKIIICHVIILFLAFTVRYNALIYPVITVFTLCFLKLPVKNKTFSVSISLIPCFLFVIYTSYKYKKLTDYWQYSPFSGWQLANNAMYSYRYVNKLDRKQVPQKFSLLDKMIREYFDSTRDVKRFPYEGIKASTFYMWSPDLPLMKYRNKLFSKDTSVSELKKWASMGPLYKNYGLWIIKHYPWHFTKYFLWPNSHKYYAPPIEFLGAFNSARNNVTEQAKIWFDYKNRILTTRMKNNNVWILNFYPILSGSINVLMLCTLLCYIALKGWKNDVVFSKGILLASSVWLINACFTIFASSAALRFQSFPVLLTTSFTLLLINWLWKIAVDVKIESLKSEVVIKKTILSN